MHNTGSLASRTDRIQAQCTRAIKDIPPPHPSRMAGCFGKGTPLLLYCDAYSCFYLSFTASLVQRQKGGSFVWPICSKLQDSRFSANCFVGSGTPSLVLRILFINIPSHPYLALVFSADQGPNISTLVLKVIYNLSS